MSRNLSPAAIASGNDESTGEVWLVLLTISHPSISPPIRVVNNVEDIESRGNTFVGLPFQVELPGEDSDNAVLSTIRVDNVDRQIVGAIRSLSSPPTCDVEVILASSANTVEIGFYDMTMRTANYDSLYIDAQLTFESIFTEPISCDQTPARFPALF